MHRHSKLKLAYFTASFDRDIVCKKLTSAQMGIRTSGLSAAGHTPPVFEPEGVCAVSHHRERTG